MPADMSLIRKSAIEVVALLECGEVTPLDCLDVLEARIAEADAPVNALPTLCFDRARAHARAIMDRPVGGRGLLSGLPVGIKHLNDVSGVVTLQGSPIFARNIAAPSSP